MLKAAVLQVFRWSINFHHLQKKTSNLWLDPWPFFAAQETGRFPKNQEKAASGRNPNESRNLDVSKNRGTPKSSILMGCSIINHPFWDTTIFGNTYFFEEGMPGVLRGRFFEDAKKPDPKNPQFLRGGKVVIPLIFPNVPSGSPIFPRNLRILKVPQEHPLPLNNPPPIGLSV